MVRAMTPIVMVIDRPSAARIAADVKALGGAWTEMFEAWQRTSLPYLAMMAHTKERLRLRAPLTAMVADDDGLRLALRHFCSHVINMKVQWALFIELGSPAEQIARQELLLDSVVEGHS
jgi:hypothetical protein